MPWVSFYLPTFLTARAATLLSQGLLVSACGLLLPGGCWRVFADWGMDKVCPKKLGWARCRLPMRWRSALTAFWHHRGPVTLSVCRAWSCFQQ